MPKIRPYDSPQFEAQSQNLRSNADLMDQSMGKTVERAGQMAMNAQEANYKRQAQSEVSDLNAKFSEARAEWTQKIDDGIRNGEIDTDKVGQDYQDYVNKMSEGIETREGQDFFTRQSANLGGYVLKNASRGQAAVAGAKAEASWQSAINNNANVLQHDPTGFSDVYQSNLDAIDSQVATGSIPAIHAEKMKIATGKELSKAAMFGWAKLSPEIAQKKLDAGEYDKYLDPDTKQQVQGYINGQSAAKDIEERRALAAQEKAAKLRSEAWQTKMLPDLVKTALPTQTILDSPMSADDKIKWMKLADEAVKNTAFDDPRVMNDLTRKINTGQITSVAQLAPHVGNGISVPQLEQLTKFFETSQISGAVNQYMNQQSQDRQKLMDFAQSKIVQSGQMGGADYYGEVGLATFMAQLKSQEEQFQKDGKPVSSLYDPTSKDWFGHQATKFMPGPQEVLKKKAGFTKDNTPLNVDQLNTKIRQPGETPDAFLKRQGLAK